MNAETFCEHFATFADAPNGIARLRQMVMQLAIQGRLIPQDAKDKPADSLIADIAKFKAAATGRETQIVELDATAAGFPLPPGWTAVAFGDIMLNRDGERIPVSRDIRVGRKGPYDYYGASGVIDSIDDFLFDKSLLLIGEDGANLINRSTPIAFIAHGKYWVNNHAHVLDGISLEFLRYIELYINAIDLKPYVTGTAQPKMNQAKMNSIVVALPPLAEQRRIVEKVDQLLGLCDELAARQAAQREKRQRLVGATLDRLVSTRNPAEFPTHAHRLRNHFDQLFDTPTTIPQLRQTILQLAVQGQLVAQDSNDEPVSEFLQSNDQERHRLLADGTIRTKSSNDTETVRQSLDHVPAGWEKRPLTELCQFIDYRGRTPTRTSDGVRLITAKNVRMGAVENEPVEFVSEKQYAQWMTRGFPEVGDLLFVTEGHTMGFVGMLTHTFRFALAQRTINLHPFIKDFNRYLFYYLMSPRFQSDVVNNSTGSAAKGIKASKLKQLLIAVPPHAEQKRIVTKVTELLSLCDALESKLTQAESASTQLLSAAVHHLLQT